MAANALDSILASIRKQIARYESGGINEQNTRAILIEPLLSALGWNLLDLNEVHREYRHQPSDNPVDYALLDQGKPIIFFEAKSLGRKLDERKWNAQVIGYASVAGVQWVVLTDGNEYRVFNAHASVPVEDKLFCAFRLSDSDEKTKSVLNFISRDGLQRDLLEAQWKYELENRRLKAVNQQVHAALDSLLNSEQPDTSLVRLLTRRLRDLSPSDVRESLRRIRFRIETHTDSSIPIGPPKPPDRLITNPPRPVDAMHDTIVVPALERNFRDTFLGESRWYAVSVSEDIRPSIKYIAVYRVSPISAITHIAPVQSIEPWMDSKRSVVTFSEPAQQIDSIKLGKGVPLASRRYTSKSALDSAESVADIWGVNPKVELKQIIDAGILTPPLNVHATYRGQTLTAQIDGDGSVIFGGRRHKSLSGAGNAAKRDAGYTGPRAATRGWTFWKFTDSEGHDRPIHALRRRFFQRQRA